MLSCKNFTEEELACNHCGENKCQDEMVSLLQKLRDDVGFPIKISSGYRCPAWNKSVGGHPNSSHMEGLAVDILCSGEKALKIVEAGIRLGFTGCGISQKKGERFVHLDVKRTESKRLWSYS